MTNNKCRSKKHPNGGCGDPRCPEGQVVEVELEQAVQANDVNHFLAVKEKLEETPPTGLGKARWQRNQREIFAELKKEFDEQQIKRLTQIEFRSFNTLEEFSQAMLQQFRPYLKDLHIAELDNNTSGFGMKGLCVEWTQVADKFQHMGIGRYIRTNLMKFADEQNYVITSSPTTLGRGILQKDQEGFLEHALEHRDNLVKWYKRYGYEYNYAFDAGTHDELTGEPYSKNPSWEKQLHPEAVQFLKNSGFYVRWPNNEIPSNWKSDAHKL